ncbi:hypothetical protein Ndes2526B_g08019 [Nannochloris sp. 'desiccata']
MTTTSSRKTIEKAGRKISGPRCCPHLTDDDVIRSKTPRCSKMGEYVQYGYDSVTTSTPDLQYPRREVGSARYDGTFGEIVSRLVEQQPLCRNISFNEVIPLARLLVTAGCNSGSSLWIAIKFADVRRCTPGARLMASACKLTKKTLIAQEAGDLHKINWDIASYARRCNLIF